MEIKTTGHEVVRVVIIDDHAMLTELVTTVVETLKGFEVAGWARTEGEAVLLCERTQPDLIILDLVLTNASGFTVLKKLGLICAKARVVILSGNLTRDIIKQSLAAGVSGLISKTVSLDEFRSALLAVAAGLTYFSPEVSAAIKTLVIDASAQRATGQVKLTAREELVLGYLSQGLSSRQIAATLGVSIYTIANHRSRLMKKTGLHRAAQLSVYALRHGLLAGAQELAQPR